MLYFRTFLFAIALLVFNLGQAQAFSLPDNFHTQSTPLVLEPLPDADIKVAGVYWLPDYLEKNLDFNNQTQGGGEKPVVNPSCNNLGYTVPTFVTDWSKYDYTEFLAANRVRCYKNFSCKTSFSKSSCPQWYQLAGNSCRDTRGTFYERCDSKPCPSSYTAGRTSCSPADGYNYSSNGYSGAQICGRCDAKACAKGYSTSVTSCSKGYSFATNGMSGSLNCGICNQRPCSDGGYYDSNPNSGIYKCSNITWGSKTCQSCYQPQCSEGGYQVGATKTGYICKAVTYFGCSCYDCSTPDPCYNLNDRNPCTYGCETTFSQCTSKCSKCYTDNCRNRSAVIVNCPSNATCPKFADCSSKISSWSCNHGYHKEGNSCVVDCTPKAAATGCPYGTESCSNGCGGTTTCCKKCTLPACNSITSKPVNSSYTTASCTDCSGTKTVNTGWACNSGTYSSNGGCYEYCKHGSILYSDNTCSVNVISGKTPIGIVIFINSDGRSGKVIALTSASGYAWQLRGSTKDISCVTNYKGPPSEKYYKYTGESDTACLVSQGISNFPAANYCYNYSVAGERGWYLPAGGEIYLLSASALCLNTHNFRACYPEPIQMENIGDKSVLEATVNKLKAAGYNVFPLDFGNDTQKYISSNEETGSNGKKIWIFGHSFTNYSKFNHTTASATVYTRCMKNFSI